MAEREEQVQAVRAREARAAPIILPVVRAGPVSRARPTPAEVVAVAAEVRVVREGSARPLWAEQAALVAEGLPAERPQPLSTRPEEMARQARPLEMAVVAAAAA
jgi:hypothetical protein